MLAVEIKNLTKFYGKQPSVLEVNLEVQEGEFIGIIGTIGSGKTTIVRMLLNFIRPTSGSASILNMDCAKEEIAIKANVGYVPADVNYPSQLKVKTIIKNTISLYNDIDEGFVTKLCETLELDISRRIGNMSLGNRKKVALVLALMKKPKVLILDDPTAGLTDNVKGKLFDLLLKINNNGTTVLYFTEDLGEVQRLCNKIAVIRSGSLLSVNNTADLFTKTARLVRIKTKEDISPVLNFFKVKHTKLKNETISFIYDGDIDDLINSLTSFHLDDLQISLPSLEDAIYRLHEQMQSEEGDVKI